MSKKIVLLFVLLVLVSCKKEDYIKNIGDNYELESKLVNDVKPDAISSDVKDIGNNCELNTILSDIKNVNNNYELESKPVNNVKPNTILPETKGMLDEFYYKGNANEININYKMKLVDFGDYQGFKTIQYKDNEWIVLDEKDDKLLLLLKDVIGVDISDESEYYEYFKSSFFDEEKNLLIDEYIKAVMHDYLYDLDLNYISKVEFQYDNVIFDSEGGDYFFILSEDEIKKYFGISDRNGMNEYRTAVGGASAKYLYHLNGSGWYKDNVPYYLRDKTDSGKFLKWVGTYGLIHNDDNAFMSFDRIGVRPAMYINKNEALKYSSEFYLNDEKMTNTIIYVFNKIYGTDTDGKIFKNGICVSDMAEFYLTNSRGEVLFKDSNKILEKKINNVKCKIYLYDNGKVSGYLGDTFIMNCDMDSSNGVYDKYTSMVLPTINGFFIKTWKNAFSEKGNYIENFYHIKKEDNIYCIDDCGYLTTDNGEIITQNIVSPSYINFEVYDKYLKKKIIKQRYYIDDKKFYCGTIKKIEGIYRYFDEKGYLISNDVYKLRRNPNYIFIDDNGIVATLSETKKINGKIYDIYDGSIYHDRLACINDKYYYYNNDGMRVVNEKIADMWVADSDGNIKGISNENLEYCNEYVKFYNIMYPKEIDKATNMRSELLDILKQVNIYKKYKKVKEQNIIDNLEKESIYKRPALISNYDVSVKSTDEDFYNNVWKINGEIVKNSVIYASNNIYGTDDNGRIIKNGLCIGKDGLTYLTDDNGKIVIDKSFGSPIKGKYYFENKGNIFTGKELVLEKFGLKVIFNKNYTIKDVSNIYEIGNDKIIGKRYIKDLKNSNIDFVVLDKYTGYQIDKDGYIIEKDKTGYYEFGMGKKFYHKTDKGGYYCVNSEYGDNMVFDEKGFVSRNEFYQDRKDLYLTDENGVKILSDKNDPVMIVDGHYNYGKRIDLDGGTIYVSNNGVVNSKFLFIKLNDTYDIYYAKDDGYIAKNCWLTDRLYFDETGKLKTENVTIKNVDSYEKWIKFYEIMG